MIDKVPEQGSFTVKFEANEDALDLCFRKGSLYFHLVGDSYTSGDLATPTGGFSLTVHELMELALKRSGLEGQVEAELGVLRLDNE